MKIERNENCICGSNKKNKNCCNLNSIDNVKFSKLIEKYTNQSLEHDEKLLLESIKFLEIYSNLKQLSKEKKDTIKINLISSYQKRGLHNDALKLLSEIDIKQYKSNTIYYTYLTLLKAKSLSAIQEFLPASETLDEVISTMLSYSDNSDGMALFLVEASKIYINADKTETASKCLENAIKILKDDENEVEHYERAKSNQAILFLYNDDEKISSKGAEILKKSIVEKSKIGDLQGLGTNYCNLGLYYWKKEDYKSAIAYLRKDLWITQKIGDLHGISISLLNLSSLYINLKQFKKAKKIINESIEIGTKIRDRAIIEQSTFQLEQANHFAKLAGIAKEPTGEKAICLCGNGKRYEECCGEADHEPIDFPFRYSGISEEIETVNTKFKKSSILDFIFRDTIQSKERLAWTKVEIKNGWYKLYELPDMSNIYLMSAKNILKNIESDAESIYNPFSCLILSVSALEAYINQVAYFLDDIKNSQESHLHNLPSEFDNGVYEFQRNTELTMKWTILGNCICEELWTPSQTIWNNFKNLIAIRNEFIHFKLSEYEQIIPAPIEINKIIRKLPSSVKTRDVFHSWPFKILTPSFAKWSVEAAEEIIIYFKKQYELKRLQD